LGVIWFDFSAIQFLLLIHANELNRNDECPTQAGGFHLERSQMGRDNSPTTNLSHLTNVVTKRLHVNGLMGYIRQTLNEKFASMSS
jgi:hypothetical protein